MEDDLQIPPSFDRRNNGRCRAYWMAHANCPMKRNPHEYALENMHRYLKKAAELDEKEGPLPACKQGWQSKEGAQKLRKPRVRQRVKGVKYA